MTISEKNTERAKSPESGPVVNAVAVLIDTASALWLDGMPPVFHRRVARTSAKLLVLFLKRLIRAFANWAIKRLNAPDIKTWFLARAAQKFVGVSMEP